MNKSYVYPSIELLDKENGGELPLAKITYKKDLANKLLVPIGMDEKKEKYYMDFHSVPVLFISGTTGSGKSIFIDSLVVSLLLKNSPEDINFMFFDPKQVELGEYKDIPHIINGSDNNQLKVDSLSYMIEYRLNLFKENHVKNIEEYQSIEKMSHVFAVIDESIDVMEIEKTKEVINMILEHGNNTGIHLVIATNGYLKKDFEKRFLSRIPYILTYELASEEESKYIKVEGANLLCEEGEGLIRSRDNTIYKINTPYISDKEIDTVVNFIKNNN